MKKLKLTVLWLLLAAAGMLVVNGCRTAHGFGEDMQNAGQAIQQKTE